RELAEETGVTEAEFLAVTDEWWAYDFPQPYAPTGHRLEAYRGQQQRWAAFRFTGTENAIDLAATGADFSPEFSEWRWARLEEAVAGVMPYKRRNYAKMAKAFARFARN
ncbi:MAG: NUDIX domain-containing protein, partial [Methylobacterium sp.]|nr:NUDIX domain-containing protein [Methylobacterium sp.]